MNSIQNSITQAVETLKQGGIVALPTEGVYGLSCDTENLNSIKNLCALKQRAEAKGFVVVAANIAQLHDLIEQLSSEQLALVNSTWPGPVTWIMPAKSGVSPLIHGDADTIAVRISAHPILRAVCEQLGRPIISTSANISGNAPATTAAQVDETFTINQIDYILDGPLGDLSGPTEIRDLRSRAIIRPFI